MLFRVVLTRHSTEVTQDGPCVIGEDSKVPSMSADGKREAVRAGGEEHHLVPKPWTREWTITLKRVLIFPPGTHCHGY